MNADKIKKWCFNLLVLLFGSSAIMAYISAGYYQEPLAVLYLIFAALNFLIVICIPILFNSLDTKRNK